MFKNMYKISTEENVNATGNICYFDSSVCGRGFFLCQGTGIVVALSCLVQATNKEQIS
jgi:hypothetical protein